MRNLVPKPRPRHLTVAVCILAAVLGMALWQRPARQDAADHFQREATQPAAGPAGGAEATAQPPHLPPMSWVDHPESLRSLLPAPQVALSIQGAVSAQRNPPHPGREAVQKQLRGESAEQTFDALAGNENLAMLVPVMQSVPFSPGYYQADLRILSGMTAVRKLLEDARARPDATALMLQGRLDTLAKQLPAAQAEFLTTMSERPGGTSLAELPAVQKYRLQTAVAVYLLAETRSAQALPTLARLSRQGTYRVDNPDLAGSCPASRKLLLYGMHRLIESYPDTSLGHAARQARDEYLAEAGRCNVPAPTIVKVPTWRARYDEHDYRWRLPGMLEGSPSDQPLIDMPVYPSLDNLGALKVERLMHRARAFADSLSQH